MYSKVCNPNNWILCKNVVNLEDFVIDHQSITFAMNDIEVNNRYIFSAVHASSGRRTKFELWEHLDSISNNVDIPWFIGGDFNLISNVDEKQGGAPPDSRTIEDFVNFQNKVGLMDLGFSGYPFTWCNDHQGKLIWEPLVRVLINSRAIEVCKNFNIIHCFRVFSDHSPIVGIQSNVEKGRAPLSF